MSKKARLLGNGGLLDVRLSSFAEVNMAQKVSWTRQKSSWKGLHIMVGAKSIFEGCPARNHYFWGRRRSPNHPEIPLRLCRHGVAAFSECRKGVGENLGGNRVANKVAQRNVHPSPHQDVVRGRPKLIILLLAELDWQLFWQTAEC